MTGLSRKKYSYSCLKFIHSFRKTNRVSETASKRHVSKIILKTRNILCECYSESLRIIGKVQNKRKKTRFAWQMFHDNLTSRVPY